MATIQQLLAAIPYGKNNAVHAYDLAKQLGLPVGGNEVETRQLIREAIQQGNIILSIPIIGYWRSNNKQEIIDYINSLQERAEEIYNRSDAIRDAWNKANPNNIIP